MRIRKPQQYYTYAHYNDHSLNPIYIGKGSGGRAFSNKEYDFNEVSILMDNLSEDEAYELEYFILSEIKTQYNKHYPTINSETKLENKKYGSPGEAHPMYSIYSKRNQAKFFGTTWYYAKKLTGLITTGYSTKKQKYE